MGLMRGAAAWVLGAPREAGGANSGKSTPHRWNDEERCRVTSTREGKRGGGEKGMVRTVLGAVQ